MNDMMLITAGRHTKHGCTINEITSDLEPPLELSG